ncbi:GNAT family N-acetyltransferase [Cryobacterium sp. W22_MBD10_FK3]|jgi:predicted GNAT family acetyltransferase|uniref:GNAT family N-acetyltransferase n=1 Tax=Cryobacterium sp. W22_MBD10_FK3 TaxID=3240273 RepID=UPI003F927DD5
MTSHEATIQVEHEPDLSRYTLRQDGEPVGLADYRLIGQELRFTHTEIDPARRDLGLAGILIERALDDVRIRTDLTVVADCPYVAEWIDQHAEYQDLLSRGR